MDLTSCSLSGTERAQRAPWPRGGHLRSAGSQQFLVVPERWASAEAVTSRTVSTVKSATRAGGLAGDHSGRCYSAATSRLESTVSTYAAAAATGRSTRHAAQAIDPYAALTWSRPFRRHCGTQAATTVRRCRGLPTSNRPIAASRSSATDSDTRDRQLIIVDGSAQVPEGALPAEDSQPPGEVVQAGELPAAVAADQAGDDLAGEGVVRESFGVEPLGGEELS